MKTTKQKAKQIKTQKTHKKRQKDYNPDIGSTGQTRHRVIFTNTVKTVLVVTLIKQSPVLKGNLFLVLS
jgi:hypothetical protein